MAADVVTTLQLTFEEKKPVGALDLSSLIFDINRLHVLATKSFDAKNSSAEGFKGYGRNSFRLPHNLRLNIARIRFESPGLLELAFFLASTIWIMVKTVEKLTFWPLNQQKLQLEIMKLEQEIGIESTLLLNERIEPFLNFPEVRSAAKQLESNLLKPSALEISLGSGVNTRLIKNP